MNKDVFIITRPDHSLQIYDALKKQEKVTFTYLVFKVVPNWVKKIWNNKKLVGVGKDAVISVKTTIVNLCRYSFHIPFAKEWNEENIMDKQVRDLLKKNKYKILHYWPLYCYKAVDEYVASHPDVISMADIHMPNPTVIMKDMKPIYEKYGITDINSNFSEERNIRMLKNAQSIIVPSEYVADTFRVDFPDKKYYVVTYGITVDDNYQKRQTKEVKSFVYAGGSITLEKGCDLLCDYFSTHQEYEVHLYGEIAKSQKHVFEKYLNVVNIHFHGLVAKAELQKKLTQYDVGIHFSRFDAYSLSVGEIVGCGIPVIVSEKTGIACDVTDYGWGEVCELSIDSIDKHIKSICDKKNYQSYIDNIDKYIKTNHKTFGDKMVDFYTELIH